MNRALAAVGCLLRTQLFCLLACLRLSGAEHYVSPTGTASADGTIDHPWDLASAVSGARRLSPGDTLWLLEGTYAHTNRNANGGLYEIRLAGATNRPIQVRGMPGRRVIIDGGLSVQPPSEFLWVRDLEIMVSENLTRSRRFEDTGSSPASYDRPWGGLHIHSGTGCKFINLVIHDCAQGVSWWSGNKDSELYGCIIFDNGWFAPDRGHGHAIYTQNKEGIKGVKECLMTGGYGYTLHAYGSRQADVENYLVEGCICWDAGRFLIGGGRPSRGIVVVTNLLAGLSMQLGYNAPTNFDCNVQGNLIVDGQLEIKGFGTVKEEGNRIYSDRADRPRTNEVWIRQNRYDPDRAHVAVVNWENRLAFKVDLGRFVEPGDRFALFSPKNTFDQPLLTGSYQGRPIEVATTNLVSVYVLKRTRP